MNVFVLEFIFSTLFLSKLFSIFFFQNLLSKIVFPTFFFQNFFCKIFFPKICFSKLFFQHFFLKIFFFTYFQHFFLKALLSMPSRLQRRNGLCVMKNMISKRSKFDFSLVWLFFGSYCSHRTRRKKCNSFTATHNILLYFFRNLLYLRGSWSRFFTDILATK